MTTGDPRKAACEVQGAGYRWEPNSQICLPPGLAQPAQAGVFSEIAKSICAAMAGQWDGVAMECQTANNKYGLAELQTGAMPPDPCPSDRPVRTPEGCFPHPGGVTDQPPQVSPVPSTPVPKTPSWVVPAVVVGIGAVVVIALVGGGAIMDRPRG
jgi:hypothetical protein